MNNSLTWRAWIGLKSETMSWLVKLDEFMDEDSESWDLAGNECGSSYDELDCNEHGNCVLRQCKSCGMKISCDVLEDVEIGRAVLDYYSDMGERND